MNLLHLPLLFPFQSVCVYLHEKHVFLLLCLLFNPALLLHVDTLASAMGKAPRHQDTVLELRPGERGGDGGGLLQLEG